MAKVNDHVTLVLPSNPEDVSKVEHFIDDFSEKNKLGEDVHGTLAITVTEIVNNAMIHGNKRDKSKNVKLELLHYDTMVKIQVTDEGTGFDTKNKPDPLTPENIYKSSGRGVFIVENMMSDVSYEKLPEGFKVTMELMTDGI